MRDRMTSRERLLAAIRRQPVDYVPCSPFLNPQDRIQRLGQTYNFPFGPSREETVQYGVEVLGLDMVVSVTWQSHFPKPGVSSRMRMEGNVLEKVWSTPAGDLLGSIHYDNSWPHGYDIPFFTDYSIGRIIEPWLQTEQDLACLKHILCPPESDSDLADVYRLATILETGTGLSGAHQICDSERLCLMAIDNPDLIDGYLELEHTLNMKNYEIGLDIGVDIIRRNGFYETTDFFSPPC